jgi:pimeloyl-ACP methyl ester carboxylesterase
VPGKVVRPRITISIELDFYDEIMKARFSHRRAFIMHKQSVKRMVLDSEMEFEKIHNCWGGLNERTTEGKGTPVLLLHGIPSSMEEWNPFWQELIDAGYKPYSVDLPGHGQSAHSDNPECYAEEPIYNQILHWIQSLDIDEPFILIGHSFGGHLAIRYTCENPARVARLILINPFLTFRQMTLMNRLPFYFPAFTARMYRHMPSCLIHLFVWLGSLQPGRFLRSTLSKDEMAAMLRDYQRCSDKVVYIPKSVTDLEIDYSKLTMPVFLIWGLRDGTLKTSEFKQLADRLPACKVHTINAGHYPHRTNTHEVKHAILEFLRRV